MLSIFTLITGLIQIISARMRSVALVREAS